MPFGSVCRIFCSITSGSWFVYGRLFVCFVVCLLVLGPRVFHVVPLYLECSL